VIDFPYSLNTTPVLLSFTTTDADIIQADTEQPENNREVLILSVENVKKKSKVHNLLLLMMPAFVGDIERNLIKAQIVADGYGLLIHWPSLPWWFLFKFSKIMKKLKKDGDFVPLIEQEHDIHKAEIKSEASKFCGAHCLYPPSLIFSNTTIFFTTIAGGRHIKQILIMFPQSITNEVYDKGMAEQRVSCRVIPNFAYKVGGREQTLTLVYWKIAVLGSTRQTRTRSAPEDLCDIFMKKLNMKKKKKKKKSSKTAKKSTKTKKKKPAKKKKKKKKDESSSSESDSSESESDSADSGSDYDSDVDVDDGSDDGSDVAGDGSVVSTGGASILIEDVVEG